MQPSKERFTVTSNIYTAQKYYVLNSPNFNHNEEKTGVRVYF